MRVLTLNLLGWNGWRITIPIFARHRNFAFFKQAKDHDDKTDNPKMIAWPKGHLKLYGREYLTSEASQIVFCEGSSTDWCWEPIALRPSPQPLARERKKEWAKEFESIPEVYICFDNDEAWKGWSVTCS